MRKLGSITLRFKILGALLLLSVVPVIATMVVISWSLDNQLSENVRESTAKIASFVESTMTLSQVEKGNYLELMASNTNIVNAVYYATLTGDAEQMSSILLDIRKQLDFDLLEVLDPNGNLLIRSTELEGLKLEDPKEHIVVQGSLEGELTYDIDYYHDKLGVIAAVPVRLQSDIVGHMVGTKILDSAMANSIRALTGAEIAFFDTNGIFASSHKKLQQLDFARVRNMELRETEIDQAPHRLFTNNLRGANAGVLMGLDISRTVGDRNNMRQVMLVIILIAGAFSLFIGLVIASGIVRPLGMVLKNLRDIAEGEGDLTKELDVRSSDEVGMLAENFNLFMNRMREMVKRTRTVTRDLVKANEQIRSSSRQVDEGAKQQSSALAESHQSLESINETAQGIAESTSSLLDASEESSSATLELGATIEEIASQMEKLFSVVEEISSSISQMSVSSQQITDNIETLSSSTEVTASSVTELDASIKEIEENAEKTDQFSEEAAQDAQRGKEAVDATVEGVTSLADVVEQSSLIIQDLGSQSNSIGKILTVIDEVADQTSLLALNAAIIAAQAGEHGKGFAVVADEIGELAERSAASTREIATIIKTLQNGASEAVESMTNGRNQAREEVERAKLAGDALEKIRTSTFKAREQVRAIVRATQEQSRGSRQITTSVNQVASMLGQIASAIKQQSVGIQQLARGSETMKEIASQVKRSTDEQAAGSRQINKNMESIRSMIERIEQATREQTQRSRQVVDAVSSVRKVAEENASRTAELDQVVEVLTQQTGTIEEEMDIFKV
ncbi:MAG: hypothetical protein C0624_01240 [Desulfuromonas sp.]|nr:MAG: hypothetical protein C0624_01240 [Desulfuromonas sp.]